MIQKTTWDSRGDNQGFIKWFLGLATFLLGLTPLSAEAASPARPILSGLKNPTAVAVGSDNRVYIATAGEFGKPGDGAVFVLEGAKAVPFAAGLDDPIALAGWGEWLYVADQNRVWRLNRQGKKEVYAAADAFPGRQGTFLGLDVDEEGRLYVSASGLEGKDGAIYRIDPKGKVDVVTRDMPSSALKMPGRLAMDGYSFLLVVDPMTGLLLRLKLADGTTTKLADSLVAGGLAWDKFGRLFLSDAKSGRLLAIPRPGEKPVLLASGLHPASGICVDPAGRFVLVPDTHAGTVTAIPAAIPGWEVNETPMPVATEVAFPNLEWTGWEPENDLGQITPLRPIILTHAGDGSNRVFVATQRGVIHVFPNDQKATKTQVFLDLSKQVSYNDDRNEEGFLGLAFHPNYKKNGEFFVFYTTTKTPLTNILARYRVRPDDPNKADPSSEEVLLTIHKPFWNHNGGTLVFGRDGYLYVAVGDGGSANDPFNHGQDLGQIFAKILRLDVDHKEAGKNYAIPPDNPFVNRSGARPEVYAYGLRNVWRMAFDRQTGVLWAGDVGQNLYEEIDRITPGANYGWNRREGLHPFNPNGSGPRPDLTEPIWEYRHDLGKCIIGGAVYRGRRIPELQGYYLYAEYVVPQLWALRCDEGQRRTVANRKISIPNVPILSFGEDEEGELYFMTYTTSGRGIYRFVKP